MDPKDGSKVVEPISIDDEKERCALIRRYYFGSRVPDSPDQGEGEEGEFIDGGGDENPSDSRRTSRSST
ncbi:hypothetical protein FRC15_003531, partial [Serendipita sp. 397]